MQALFREIDGVAEMCGQKKLNSIYMGGGTPTTLMPRILPTWYTPCPSFSASVYRREKISLLSAEELVAVLEEEYGITEK